MKFLDPTSGQEGQADTVDISANGLGLVTPENLSAQTTLEIWLGIPGYHQPFYTRGEVMWSQASLDSRTQQVGVRLEKAELMGLARVLRLKERASLHNPMRLSLE